MAIAFVGDSYCACYGMHVQQHAKSSRWQCKSTSPAWTSLVAEHFDTVPLAHGFGSKSWWYSRVSFLKALEKTPQLFDEIDAVIFCHTDYSRINNSDNHDLSNSIQSSQDQAVSLYLRHLYDTTFQKWTCEQWFKEIAEMFGAKKTIHFHSFLNTIPMSDYLPGTVFTTPLVHITVGQETGTTTQIENSMSNTANHRHNHFNDHNNRAMAHIVIDALEDYQPGQRSIDLTRFDQPNVNAHRWPAPGYGTK